MDTISHAIVGIAAAGFSGHAVSVSDPVYWAALVGSQAPDFDIAFYARGKFSYLKQHRSFSHSLPGILLWAGLTSLGFSLFFSPQEHLVWSVFLWCLLGSLSHVALDWLNTHGVAFFWPVAKRRQSLNLLNVFDPCLLVIMALVLMLSLAPVVMSTTIFGGIGAYIGVRCFLRRKAARQLAYVFGGAAQTFVLPSLRGIFFWDFIVKTSYFIYVGQISALRFVLGVHAKLPREKMSTLVKTAKKTNLGRFFTAFTPFSYFKEEREHCGKVKIVRIYDLRYFFGRGFAYSAAIIFGPGDFPCQSYVCAYGKKIKTPCL